MVRLYHTLIICAVLAGLIGCSKKQAPAAPQKEEGATKQEPALGLMTVVPDNVVAFVAGAGCDNVKDGFEKSILGRMWNDPELKSFVDAATEQLLAKVKEEIGDANEAQAPGILLDFAKLAVNRPIIAGAAMKECEDGPPVYGFAILDGGSKKAEIAAAIEKLEALDKKGHIVEVEVGPFKMHGPADDDGVPGYWGWAGDYLVFAVNDPNGLAVAHIQQPRTAAPPDIERVPTVNDICTMYVDCRKTADVVKVVADRQSASDRLAIIATVIETLGLNNVARLTSAARFVGPDLVFTESVEAPQPRTGLFASLKPVDMKMFDMVDARAVRAGAVNCSIASIYDTIMAAIEAGAPDVAGDIDQKIVEIQSEMKVDIRKDLLGSLAGPAVFYSIPGGIIMEAPEGGFVAIAEAKDAALLEKTLTALGEFATAKGKDVVRVSSQPQDGGRTLHTCVIAPLAMMQLMPCWIVVDDHIVIASNPGLHKLALARVVSPGSASPSILTIEGFKKASAGLPSNLVYFSYTDSKVQFKQIMLALQGMWPMVNMFAAKAGMQLPAMLPSLTSIIEEMGPSVQYSWFDDKGLHSLYRGSGVEVSAGTSIAGAALGTAVLMPALARVREQARRVASASNLKQIGLILYMYAQDHDGRFPEDLQGPKEYIKDSNILESPRKPKDFDGPSYVYIPGHSWDANDAPNHIIAYENPEICEDKINVLFLDMHVEAVAPDRLIELLETTYKGLGREMPEVKFKEGGGSSTLPFLR
ncbi:MAG TPA: hypothetical protein VJJ98_00155 [Sedimentisphaerales bacterium]|nr:hypothetical protein [Sedimentisphaerales bacterium]